MPNPVYIYIYIYIYRISMICKHKSMKLNSSNYSSVPLTIQLNISDLFTQLNVQTILFQTIQFSISLLFAQFKCQTVLFDPLIGPYQVLLLRTKVDLEAIVMKAYSAFSKAPALLEPQHQIVLCYIQDTRYECGFAPEQRFSRCILQPQLTQLRTEKVVEN